MKINQFSFSNYIVIIITSLKLLFLDSVLDSFVYNIFISYASWFTHRKAQLCDSSLFETSFISFIDILLEEDPDE